MNKVAGIGIAVIIIAVIIAAAMSFSNDSDPTTRQSGPFTIESSQEISEEKTAEGINYSITLSEKIGVNP